MWNIDQTFFYCWAKWKSTAAMIFTELNGNALSFWRILPSNIRTPIWYQDVILPAQEIPLWDQTGIRPSYLHNLISSTGKMTSLYWIRALMFQYQKTIQMKIHVSLTKFSTQIFNNSTLFVFISPCIVCDTAAMIAYIGSISDVWFLLDCFTYRNILVWDILQYINALYIIL